MEFFFIFLGCFPRKPIWIHVLGLHLQRGSTRKLQTPGGSSDAGPVWWHLMVCSMDGDGDSDRPREALW